MTEDKSKSGSSSEPVLAPFTDMNAPADIVYPPPITVHLDIQEGDVKHNLSICIAHLLETCKYHGFLARNELWRRRTRGFMRGLYAVQVPSLTRFEVLSIVELLGDISSDQKMRESSFARRDHYRSLADLCGALDVPSRWWPFNRFWNSTFNCTSMRKMPFDILDAVASLWNSSTIHINSNSYFPGRDLTGISSLVSTLRNILEGQRDGDTFQRTLTNISEFVQLSKKARWHRQMWRHQDLQCVMDVALALWSSFSSSHTSSCYLHIYILIKYIPLCTPHRHIPGHYSVLTERSTYQRYRAAAYSRDLSNPGRTL